MLRALVKRHAPAKDAVREAGGLAPLVELLGPVEARAGRTERSPFGVEGDVDRHIGVCEASTQTPWDDLEVGKETFGRSEENI